MPFWNIITESRQWLFMAIIRNEFYCDGGLINEHI